MFLDNIITIAFNASKYVWKYFRYRPHLPVAGPNQPGFITVGRHRV